MSCWPSLLLFGWALVRVVVPEKGRDRKERRGDRQMQKVEGRKMMMAMGRGNRQTTQSRKKRWYGVLGGWVGWKEVTGDRSMGEKSGERPRERVVA